MSLTCFLKALGRRARTADVSRLARAEAKKRSCVAKVRRRKASMVHLVAMIFCARIVVVVGGGGK